MKFASIKYTLIKYIVIVLMSFIILFINLYISLPHLNTLNVIRENNIDIVFYNDSQLEIDNSYLIVTDYYQIFHDNELLKSTVLMEYKDTNYDMFF